MKKRTAKILEVTFATLALIGLAGAIIFNQFTGNVIGYKTPVMMGVFFIAKWLIFSFAWLFMKKHNMKFFGKKIKKKKR